jgi:hypothetical protein
MFAMQVEEMFAGRERSAEFYALLGRAEELTPKVPAATANAWNPGAAAIASGVHNGFKNLQAQINAAYAEACRAAERDPDNPGATAEIDSSNGEIIVRFGKEETK